MKQRVENDLLNFINNLEGPAPLREACAYALLAPAKRFRPILVHQMAAAVGKGLNVGPAAIAVELLHTASLIADDLPCMDDDATRRGRPSLHEHSGEALALLTSYALIGAAYECIVDNAKGHPAEVYDLAVRAVSKNTGMRGATGGQYWDLVSPSDHLEEMILLKTGALFELSFVLGWLFGGGERGQLPIVGAAASHFGMAFQLCDDLLDLDQDLPERNFALLYGVEKTHSRILQEKEQYLACMEQLGITLELALPLPQIQELLL